MSQVKITGQGAVDLASSKAKQDSIFGALNSLSDPDFKQVFPVVPVSGSGQRRLLEKNVRISKILPVHWSSGQLSDIGTRDRKFKSHIFLTVYK